MRILLSGASGLLGATLAPSLARFGHDVVRHGSSTGADVSCDLTDRAATLALLEDIRPEIVVNLVAWTNVDSCEKDPHGAYLLNIRTVENLVAGMRAHRDTFLVQLSTDHVYDSPGPSQESNIRLTNIYALTKYAGELAAALVPSTILRTNFFGHSLLPDRRSASDWILDSLRGARPLTAFTDVVINPLSMTTLSAMVGRVIDRRVEGVFNLGSRGKMSKAEFAFEIARVYGLSTHAVTLGKSSDVALPAYRPKDMSMDCKRFEAAFDVTLPDLGDEIGKLNRGDDART